MLGTLAVKILADAAAKRRNKEAGPIPAVATGGEESPAEEITDIRRHCSALAVKSGTKEIIFIALPPRT